MSPRTRSQTRAKAQAQARKKQSRQAAAVPSTHRMQTRSRAVRHARGASAEAANDGGAGHPAAPQFLYDVEQGPQNAEVANVAETAAGAVPATDELTDSAHVVPGRAENVPGSRAPSAGPSAAPELGAVADSPSSFSSSFPTSYVRATSLSGPPLAGDTASEVHDATGFDMLLHAAASLGRDSGNASTLASSWSGIRHPYLPSTPPKKTHTLIPPKAPRKSGKRPACSDEDESDCEGNFSSSTGFFSTVQVLDKHDSSEGPSRKRQRRTSSVHSDIRDTPSRLSRSPRPAPRPAPLADLSEGPRAGPSTFENVSSQAGPSSAAETVPGGSGSDAVAGAPATSLASPLQPPSSVRRTRPDLSNLVSPLTPHSATWVGLPSSSPRQTDFRSDVAEAGTNAPVTTTSPSASDQGCHLPLPGHDHSGDNAPSLVEGLSTTVAATSSGGGDGAACRHHDTSREDDNPGVAAMPEAPPHPEEPQVPEGHNISRTTTASSDTINTYSTVSSISEHSSDESLGDYQPSEEEEPGTRRRPYDDSDDSEPEEDQLSEGEYRAGLPEEDGAPVRNVLVASPLAMVGMGLHDLYDDEDSDAHEVNELLAEAEGNAPDVIRASPDPMSEPDTSIPNYTYESLPDRRSSDSSHGSPFVQSEGSLTVPLDAASVPRRPPVPISASLSVLSTGNLRKRERDDDEDEGEDRDTESGPLSKKPHREGPSRQPSK